MRNLATQHTSRQGTPRTRVARAVRFLAVALALVILVLAYRQPEQSSGTLAMPRGEPAAQPRTPPASISEQAPPGSVRGLRAAKAGAIGCILKGADSGAERGFLAGVLLSPLCFIAAGVVDQSQHPRRDQLVAEAADPD